jgi:hypothetical protein
VDTESQQQADLCIADRSWREAAYSIKAKPNPGRVQPIDCIVMVKDGRAVLLMGGALKPDGLAEAMTELAKSWRWSDAKAPRDGAKTP